MHNMPSRLKMCSLPLLGILLLVIASRAEECGQQDDTPVVSNGVCSSIDVRNNVASLRKLENCTVIEGSLHIALLEHEAPEAYAPYTFPQLREITDHLLLYRVYGLRSLRDMFPNLEVIRGRTLFTSYALVAYEMVDLEELGLINLYNISRGGVRLAKNKKLCYINTVDWERIGISPSEQDFKYNREESQCANYCPDTCSSTTVRGVKSKRCWTSQDCQKNLNCHRCSRGQTCRENGECCHINCLGGCSGPGDEDCYTCKGITYEKRCLPQCPALTYTYFGRRCLMEKECSEMKYTGSLPRQIHHSGMVLYKGGDGPGDCLPVCPINYSAKPAEVNGFKMYQCTLCVGPCPKTCNGSHINSIQVVQKFSECNVIFGDLTIEIIGGSNIAEEMEKGLGKIKSIQGKLDIHKSYPFLNLFFFKSLETIEGGTNGKSLVIVDNNNLQELFPEEQMKKMKIAKHAFFDGNRKLCPSKIEAFQKYANLSNDMIEITASNGELLPCVDKHLNLTIQSVGHNYVVLKWEQVSMGDRRRVLSYIINYKEIKDEFVDVNIYQGRDACSEDVWMTSERDPQERGVYATNALHNLEPFTTYAVYIQAYTLSSASHSAMTQVKTFTTSPYYPSKPRNLKVTANSPHELHVKWLEPKLPNGIIHHYVVTYQREELNAKEFDKRNYCDYPVVASSETEKAEVKEKEKYRNNTDSNCCACPKTKSELEAEAKKQEMDIFFEDYLHGIVYCKRYDTLPFALNEDLGHIDLQKLSEAHLPDIVEANSRNLSVKDLGEEAKYNISSQKHSNFDMNEKTYSELGRNHPMRNNTGLEVIVNGTEATLVNLEPFREYSIMVMACHESSTSIDTKLCSARAITQGRTKPLASFDKINATTIKSSRVSNTSSDVMIRWALPTNPNGVTIKFKLFYKQANQENLVAREVCVSMQEYHAHSGYRLTGLEPGNWSFQIRPVSLGGDGVLTPERYVSIPIPPGEKPTQTGTIIAIAVIVVVISVFSIIAFAVIRHKFRKDDTTYVSQNVNYIPSEPAYIVDDWEVDRNKIRTMREIGQGSFGMVYEGIATGLGEDLNEEIRVAVKTVNDRASFNDKREFLKEATIMKAFDTFHVVKLLGVVSKDQPALVIMELMALGDLRNYLRDHRPDEDHPDVVPPSLHEILQMAGEVADGMAYLADKKFVHRDLAARNCMVAEDRTVKIGDFGMTRDIYETEYYRKGGKGMLPVRWMAPESIKDGIFSSMSDVWSFGVVMWEMVTLAAQPYQGLSNDQVIKFINGGRTMDMPERCPPEMEILMRRCWAKRSKDRPSFKRIVAYLLPHMNARFEKVSYYYNDGGGNASDAGKGLGDEPHPEEEEEESVRNAEVNSSMNSLSCEGAAAPRQSLRGASDYGYGSPTASAGSGSVYDEGIDHQVYLDEEEQPGSGRYFPRPGELFVADGFANDELFNNSRHGDFGLEMSNLDRPFMQDRFQEVPHVMVRQPNGPGSEPHNLGLIELQPLLSSGRGSGAGPGAFPWSKSNPVEASSPPSATHDFVDEPLHPQHPHPHLHHQQQSSPPASTPSTELPGLQRSSPRRSSPFSLAAVDPLRSGPPVGQAHPAVEPGGDPLWAAHSPDPRNLGFRCDPLRSGPPGPGGRPPSSSTLPPAASLAKPSLRLPTLNQPPSGGFKRVPLFNSSAGKPDLPKDNGDSQESHPESSFPVSPSSQPSGGDGDHHHSQPSLNSSEPHGHPSSPGAIAVSPSDGIKDLGSCSRVNGLSKGHIPMSTASSNRTTPC